MKRDNGLIIPHRTETGRRLDSLNDLNRISFIRKLIEEGLNLAGIRRLLALLPCWELKPCSPEMQEMGPAYDACKIICWMFSETACKDSEKNCSSCSVYLQSIDNINNLKQILKLTK